MLTSAFHAENVSFDSCMTDGEGGGLYADTYSESTLLRSAVVGCAAASHGGGVHINFHLDVAEVFAAYNSAGGEGKCMNDEW